MRRLTVDLTDAEMRELLGDKFLALQSIARRLYVKRTAKDMRLFTALVETVPVEVRDKILAAVRPR